MKQYILIMNQEGEGCDYTIACGKEYNVFEAENHDDAINKAKEILDYFSSLDFRGEKMLEDCEIYELSELVANKHDYLGWLAERKLYIESEENKQKEAEEKEKLISLLAKYDMTEDDIVEKSAEEIMVEAMIRRQNMRKNI